MKFTIGKILSGHFWYTKFWVPSPPLPPALPLRTPLPTSLSLGRPPQEPQIALPRRHFAAKPQTLDAKAAHVQGCLAALAQSHKALQSDVRDLETRASAAEAQAQWAREQIAAKEDALRAELVPVAQELERERALQLQCLAQQQEKAGAWQALPPSSIPCAIPTSTSAFFN